MTYSNNNGSRRVIPSLLTVRSTVAILCTIGISSILVLASPSEAYSFAPPEQRQLQRKHCHPSSSPSISFQHVRGGTCRKNGISRFCQHDDNVSHDFDRSEDKGSIVPEADCDDNIRRSLFRTTMIGLSTTSALSFFLPDPAVAGEVGARITKAVTTSDLGISVRTSVVKGAQVMDKVDGQWEKFSDKFGLGSERSRAGQRPKPKIIPDPVPLNVNVAKQILAKTDEIFCSIVGIQNPSDLQTRVIKIANLVRVSFERSGVTIPKKDDGSNDNNDILNFVNNQQFNFVSYVHFRTYSDIIIERKVDFNKFRNQFEQLVGKEISKIVLSESKLNTLAEGGGRNGSGSKKDDLDKALTVVDDFLSSWKSLGLISLYETPVLDEDKVDDWVDEIVSDLELNYALDGDVTLNAQILLQEQGYRLYPNFARFAMTSLFSSFNAAASDNGDNNNRADVDRREEGSSPQGGWKVGGSMDYYFDTDYNSDPDKFEVKEVLVSIQLENP